MRERTGMTQTPSRSLVTAKIRQVFPACDETEMLARLDRYEGDGNETHRSRVQLAILKLCDEEGLSDPTRTIEAAKRDARDVLAWAEYPASFKAPRDLPPEDRDRLREWDRRQYEDWLSKNRTKYY